MQHFLGRRPVLTLLRKEKVAAEPTDELHFLKALALVARFLSSNARFKGLNLAPSGEGGADLLIQTNKYHKKSNRTLILIMQPLELR